MLVAVAKQIQLQISNLCINQEIKRTEVIINQKAELKPFEVNLSVKNIWRKTLHEKKEMRRPDISQIKIGTIDLRKDKNNNINSSKGLETVPKLIKIQNERDYAFKMVGLLSKSYLKMQKENKILKEKLAACRWIVNDSNNSSGYAIGSYETHDTNYISKHANSETGSNDPYQFRRHKYYEHKPKGRTLSKGTNDIKNYSIIRDKHATKTFNSSCKIKSHDFEDDDLLFLEAEKKAQEAYLVKPVRIEEIKGNEGVEKRNLLNVLNNQIINKQIKSESKPKGINFSSKVI